MEQRNYIAFFFIKLIKIINFVTKPCQRANLVVMRNVGSNISGMNYIVPKFRVPWSIKRAYFINYF
jgi:hypothetical protein